MDKEQEEEELAIERIERTAEEKIRALQEKIGLVNRRKTQEIEKVKSAYKTRRMKWKAQELRESAKKRRHAIAEEEKKAEEEEKEAEELESQLWSGTEPAA